MCPRRSCDVFISPTSKIGLDMAFSCHNLHSLCTAKERYRHALARSAISPKLAEEEVMTWLSGARSFEVVGRVAMIQQLVFRMVYCETRKADFDVPRSSRLLKPLTSIRPGVTRTLVVPCHWEKTKVFAEKVHEIWSLQVRPNQKLFQSSS